MRQIAWILSILGVLLAASCRPDTRSTLTVLTHDSFNISESVLATFEAEHGVTVELLPAGDTGRMLNQAILAGDTPLADVIFGVDNTFMGRALSADILERYRSPALAGVISALDLDPSGRLTPIDYGDVCLNYDIGWFRAQRISPPVTLADLTEPTYRGLTVVENPATSSPGLAFLLVTVATFGEDNYLDYWQRLRANEVLVTSGWEEAYYGAFSAASDGDRPIVVSYATSPAAEVFFGELSEAFTASVTSPGTCFRQVEFAGILRGTQQRALAEAFIDFMLSPAFQADIPLNMFVFPALAGAPLPEVFVAHASAPAEPVTLDPATIDARRGEWIEAWTQVVLR